MKVLSLLLTLPLLGPPTPCFGRDDDKARGTVDPCFDRHNEQIVESMRQTMRRECGEPCASLTPTEEDEALQTYVEAYLRAREAERALVETRNQPMTFFGRVVDEKNRPLEGAVVTMSVEQEEMVCRRGWVKERIYRQHQARTDATGTFVIQDTVGGWKFTLDGIESDGYRYDRSKQPASSFFPVTHPSQLKADYFFRQDPKFPVMFVLTADKKNG